MIQITPQLALEDREVTLDFVRASGPGGVCGNREQTVTRSSQD